MLAGELLRRQERIASLQQESDKLSEKIAALDSAMALADARVKPEALGAVKATAERYEGWGGLTRFIVAEIQAAGPTGIDTTELARRAACRFAVPVESRKDLSRYSDSVTWTLRDLRKKRVIENVHVSRGGHKPSVWRERTDAGLFDDLLKQRDAIEGNLHG